MQHSHCQIGCMPERPDTGLSSPHVGGQKLPLTTGRFGAIPPRAYQRSRVARTARIVLSAREMGRIFHAKGVERLVRNELWKGRSQERFYDAMEWLYGWKVENCLSS